MPKTTLDTIASRLRTVHKLLLDFEQRIYEKTYGRVDGPYQLLGLAMNDPQFAWLRAMSGEMAHLDEVRLGRAGVTETDLRLIGTRIRALLMTDRVATDFQKRYEEAKAQDPSILMAHVDLVKSLPRASGVELFLSAGGEQDTKDPLPAAIRPGTLIPGFGDRGYGAVGAIEERGLLANVPLKPARYANEAVLDIASVATEIDIDGEHVDVDPWQPVVARAGVGSTVARIPRADGVLVSVYVRQPALGGEPDHHLPEASEYQGWLQLADPEIMGSDVTVLALIAAAGTTAPVPAKEGNDVLLYVLAGTIEVDGVEVPDSRLALVRNPKDLRLQTGSEVMVLAILVNPAATVTRAGSVAR